MSGEWQQLANCATTDPELFFSDFGTYDTARKVCAFCPVRAQCLQEALEQNETFGMRGGLTPTERRQMQRRVA